MAAKPADTPSSRCGHKVSARMALIPHRSLIRAVLVARRAAVVQAETDRKPPLQALASGNKAARAADWSSGRSLRDDRAVGPPCQLGGVLYLIAASSLRLRRGAGERRHGSKICGSSFGAACVQVVIHGNLKPLGRLICALLGAYGSMRSIFYISFYFSAVRLFEAPGSMPPAPTQ